MTAPSPPRQGTGYVNAGTPNLTVVFEDAPWWLQITRPDGEGYLDFLPLDRKPVTAADVARFVPGHRNLTWRELRAPPGMPAACEASADRYVVHLNAQRGAPLGPEELQAAFAAFMTQSGGRRLA